LESAKAFLMKVINRSDSVAGSMGGRLSIG
jgi:hypothetical protein